MTDSNKTSFVVGLSRVEWKMDPLSMRTLLFVTSGLLPEAVTSLPRTVRPEQGPQHPTNGEACVAENDEFYLPQAEPGKGLWKALWSGSVQGDSLISQNSVLVATARRDAGSCWKELSLSTGQREYPGGHSLTPLPTDSTNMLAV